jgi:hypothetical protein
MVYSVYIYTNIVRNRKESRQGRYIASATNKYADYCTIVFISYWRYKKSPLTKLLKKTY